MLKGESEFTEKFTLCETLGVIDRLGEGYVYKLKRNAEQEDIFEVSYEEYGKEKNVKYRVDEVEQSFRTGEWVEVK